MRLERVRGDHSIANGEALVELRAVDARERGAGLAAARAGDHIRLEA
jgi:hypothetical protein